MKRRIYLVVTCILVFALVGCGENSKNHEGEAKTPSASSSQKGKNYEEVVAEFEEKGFKNIKTEKLEDLITGWLTKDGEVEAVTVDGDNKYSSDKWYPNDVPVVITYHTFKEETENNSSDDKKDNSESTNQSNSESNPKVEDEILTVENNEDLVNLLAAKETYDSIIGEFAKKYDGRTIEFDGNIAHMINHGDYKTRYDFLIYVGDYSETSASGPSFQFRDVSVGDLHLTGDNIPEYINAGQNLHIVAKVVEYEEKSNLFILKPISIEVR